MPDSPQQLASVRYIVDDVQDAIDFYTAHLGFELQMSAAPAMAVVTRGGLRLVLSGPDSPGARALPDGRVPQPGGWNRIHLTTQDIDAEVERLKAAGLKFRSEVIIGVGGNQILLDDPSGNPIELYQPTYRPPTPPGPSGT
jgi:catechol 2,3-dioxygenase-like lactoylglutathione lyase family enzyme